jgi:hypothetical protein
MPSLSSIFTLKRFSDSIWETAAGTVFCVAIICILHLVLNSLTTLFFTLALLGYMKNGMFRRLQFEKCDLTLIAFAFSAPTVIWVALINSHQLSDFGVYYNCGFELANSSQSFKQWTQECQSQWMPGFDIYWRRSLLYTAPIGWLFGNSYWILKLANLVLYEITLIVLLFGTSRLLDKRIAILAGFIFCFSAEYWFVKTVASSDNMAICLITILIVQLSTYISEKFSIFKLISLTLIILALELLRNIGPVLIISLGILSFGSRNVRARILVLLASSVLSIFIFGKLVSLIGYGNFQSFGYLSILALNGMARMRDWDNFYTLLHYILPSIENYERTSLTLGLIAQDLTSALSMPKVWYQKAVILFSGNGYYFFALSPPLNNVDDKLIQGAPVSLILSTSAGGILKATSMASLLVGSVGMWSIINTAIGRVSIALAASFITFLILFGEVQARYSLLFLPALCILAGGIAITPTSQFAVSRFETKKFLMILFVTVCIFSMWIIACKIWADFYLADKPRIVWSNGHQTCTSPKIIVKHRVLLETSDATCPPIVGYAKNVRGSLTAFLAREPTSPKWDQKAQAPITIGLKVFKADGVYIEHEANLLEYEQVRKINIPLNQEMTRIELTSRSANSLPQKISLSYLFTTTGVVLNQ